MKKIYVFGTGKGADVLNSFLIREKVRIISYLDNDISRQGKYRDNIQVIPPDNIKSEFDAVILTMKNYKSVKEQLTGYGVSEDKIISLYDNEDLSKESANGVLKYKDWSAFLVEQKYKSLEKKIDILFGMMMDVRSKLDSAGDFLKLEEILKKLDQLLVNKENQKKESDVNSYAESVKRPIKVDMITTWNMRCGIAISSRHLTEAMRNDILYSILADRIMSTEGEDESFVRRIWDRSDDDMLELINYINNSDSELVHIEWHYAIFGMKALLNLIQGIRKKIIVEIHNSESVVSIYPFDSLLNKVDCYIVHKNEDLGRLSEYGIIEDKVKVIPHGQLLYKQRTIIEAREHLGLKEGLYVGMTGFLFRHKGVKQMIRAISMLKQRYGEEVFFLAPCSVNGSIGCEEYYGECMEEVYLNRLEKNVFIIKDFLPEEKIILLLQACDVVALPYDYSPESASGSVRFCVASGRPIILTDTPIFSEFKDKAFMIKDNKPEEIMKAVEQVINRSDPDQYVIDNSGDSWAHTAERMRNVYLNVLK